MTKSKQFVSFFPKLGPKLFVVESQLTEPLLWNSGN